MNFQNEDQGQTPMEFLKYWRIIFAFRGMIILLSLSALITAVLLTYVLPEKYDATAFILLRPQEKIKLAPNRAGKEILDFPVSQVAPIDAPSKTYIEVIKSRAVVGEVVRVLGLDKKQRKPSENYYKELWERFKEEVRAFVTWAVKILKYGRVEKVDPFTKAVEDVQESLSLETTKDTYLFEITCFWHNPTEAAAVANAAAEIFIEYMSDANKKESMSSRLFLESRLLESAKDLAESRLALRKFKEKYGTFSLSEEYSAKLKIINDLESDLEKTEGKLAGLVKNYTLSYPKVVSLLAEKDRVLQSLAERKSELHIHPDKEKQLENVKLRVKVAEDNYSSVNKAYEEARIQEANKISEIRLVSPAIEPVYPLKPIKIYYAGAALAIALLGGVGLAFFLEFQKAKIRNIEYITAVLQLRVLATIPLMKLPS